MRHQHITDGEVRRFLAKAVGAIERRDLQFDPLPRAFSVKYFRGFFRKLFDIEINNCLGEMASSQRIHAFSMRIWNEGVISRLLVSDSAGEIREKLLLSRNNAFQFVNAVFDFGIIDAPLNRFGSRKNQ